MASRKELRCYLGAGGVGVVSMTESGCWLRRVKRRLAKTGFKPPRVAAPEDGLERLAAFCGTAKTRLQQPLISPSIASGASSAWTTLRQGRGIDLCQTGR